MIEAVDFHNRIGVHRVVSRATRLAEAVKQGVAQKLPGATFVTPIPHQMSWGVVVFNDPDLDTGNALDALYELDVGCAIMNGNVRYSPHFYNTLEDIERAIDAITHLV